MIHLSDIFVVRKGKYSPICVSGPLFATNGKNAQKNCNNCQKLSIIIVWSSAIEIKSKITISHELGCQEESAFVGLLFLSHINLNTCPITVMWQVTKFSYCEYIKMIHLQWVFLSGRVNKAKYVFQRIILAQNGKNSLRKINNSPKTTGNKAQTIKLMMPALNITIGYVRR